MKKIFLLTIGFIATFLGIIGILLPVLPTTPFLILAASCFLKSSKTFYNRLISNKILGSYIKNYIEYKAITIKSKILGIVLMWIFTLLSAFLFIKLFYIRILLLVIALVVTVFLVNMKVLTKEMLSEKL